MAPEAGFGNFGQARAHFYAHGLGQVPQFRMIKRLTGGNAFIAVTHVGLAGNANNQLFLNSNAAAGASGSSQDPGSFTATNTFVGDGVAASIGSVSSSWCSKAGG